MTPLLATFAGRWVELASAAAALAVLVKAVKYRDFTGSAALGRDDLGWVALLGLGLSGLALLGPVGCVLGVLAGTLLLSALWLDAVLFRIFTIELGPGGVGSVILSVLYRELAELAFARRFFSAHRLFAVLPLAALVLQGAVLFTSPGALRLAAVALPTAWLLLCATFSVPPRARRQIFAACAVLGASAGVEWLLPHAAWALAAVPLGMMGWAWLPPSRRAAPDALRHFVIERAWPDPPDFQPRPEHAPLLAQPPRAPRASEGHGLLRGCDVVLFTFESVGRAHLSALTPGGAPAAFFERLLPGALRSRHHACVSPTTNNAHAALYTSGYGAGASACLDALRKAGYRTAYLSTAHTGDYGLRPILDAAGFEHVIDRDALAPPGGPPPPDQLLLSAGMDRLQEALRGHRPFFLHVHATHTHVPYRVAEPERFHRFDMSEDRGRFFNGIEESDWLFGALLEELRRRGLTEDPLVVISSDHGQAFGGLGYQSHGSAVTREELDVPLLFHHGRLPAREAAFSSHFDVLPTVLDLVGVQTETPLFGGSLMLEDKRPELLVWAGHPSRRTTSHAGLLLAEEKWMVDLALDRCLRMDWRDEHVEELSGAEKDYVQALVFRLMRLRGVT
ncbi:Phosphoglycerol transferase MdoB [Stigmatella aurantiaca]|uniref:Phosphoglycerol transferase MdoB n=1 Tax=Stigmatella aurantiaca TaxID=41 RepID=A0A1H8AZR7_STIAU|nr:sulfatase-like hydrolase/transferase [Stigmatella aurantiaca]SEM76212.1 Phosphoglycerol transferase MdoB [Stigmatella aurantiaca]